MLSLVLVLACNSIVGFDDLERSSTARDGGARVDGGDDDVIDPPPMEGGVITTPRCDPAQPFGQPTLMTELDGTEQTRSGVMTPDELEIFYLRGSSSPFVLRHAIRTSRDAKWGEPTTEAFSQNAVSLGSIAVQGLKLYYWDIVSNPPNSTSFPTVATRPALVRAWGVGTHLKGGTDRAVMVVESDDAAYWTQYVFKDAGPAESYIYRGSVVGTSVVAGPIVEGLHALGSNDLNPVVIKNETTIYFTSRRAGGIADSDDVWRAERAAKGDPFGPGHLIVELSSEGTDQPTWVSEDECIAVLNRASHIYIAQRPK